MPGKIDATLAVVLTCSIAVLTDLRSRRIPNWLTLSSLILAIAAVPWSQSLPGSLAALAVYIPFFIVGWLGGGDVKLLMALGAWGGAGFALDTAINSIVIGGLLGLFALLVRGTLMDFFRRLWKFVRSIVYRELEMEAFKADPRSRLPFAIPMAIAAIGRIYGRIPGVQEWFGR